MRAKPIDVVPPRGRLLPASKGAVRIGIGIDVLRRLIKAGKIAVMRHDDGRLQGLYERDLDDWVEQHRQAAAARAPEPSRLVRRNVDQAVDALLAPDERVW